jgi:bacterial/archaeal transporter family protein
MNWIILAIFSALVFGLEDFLKKKVLKVEKTFQFLALHYILTLLLLLPLISYVNFSIGLGLSILILVRTMLFFFVLALFTESLKHLPLSIAAPISNVKIVFGLILGILLLHEKSSSLDIVGTAVILLGCHVINTNGQLLNFSELLRRHHNSRYVYYLFASGLFFALAMILTKPILLEVDSLSLLFYHTSLSAAIYLLVIFSFYGGTQEIVSGWKNGKWLLILIAISGILATYAQFLSLSSADSMVIIVIPILQLSLLIDVILGGKVLHEKHFKPHLLGALLVVIGSILLMV